MVTRALAVLAALAAMVSAAASASALDSQSLRLLLLGAQDMNTPQTPLRADIAVEVREPKGSRTTQAIAFFLPGPEARWYLQLREPELAALVLGTDRKVMQRHGRSTETLPIGAPIDELWISYEDLSRFIVSDFETWQITDENAQTILVGGHPAVDSAYVYRAYSFDKERTLPLRVQFYAKTLNNLVKMRLDGDHVLIGKKWFPGTIEIQNFPENTTTALTLTWTQAATVPPELLAPESFAAAPLVAWERAAAAPSPAAPAGAAGPSPTAVASPVAGRSPAALGSPAAAP